MGYIKTKPLIHADNPLTQFIQSQEFNFYHQNAKYSEAFRAPYLIAEEDSSFIPASNSPLKFPEKGFFNGCIQIKKNRCI